MIASCFWCRYSAYWYPPQPNPRSSTAVTATVHAGRSCHHAKKPLFFFADCAGLPFVFACSTRANTRWVKSGPGSLRFSASRRSSSEKCISYLSNLACESPAQVSQRAMECALYGVHRYLQHISNLRRPHPFLKAQDQHQPLLLRQTSQALLQLLQQQRVGGLLGRNRLWGIVQRQFAATLLTASLINAAVGRDPPQPIRKVRGRLYAVQPLMQLQENLLRQVFRQGTVPQKVISDAENHALVLPHQFGKRQRVSLG